MSNKKYARLICQIKPFLLKKSKTFINLLNLVCIVLFKCAGRLPRVIYILHRNIMQAVVYNVFIFFINLLITKSNLNARQISNIYLSL